MDGKSLDIAEEKRNRLKEILPEAFTEDKIDCEKLKATLGGNYSGMLIGRPIAIMYFLARKIPCLAHGAFRVKQCRYGEVAGYCFMYLSSYKKIKPQRSQSTQGVVISLFPPLCVLCGFPKP